MKGYETYVKCVQTIGDSAKRLSPSEDDYPHQIDDSASHRRIPHVFIKHVNYFGAIAGRIQSNAEQRCNGRPSVRAMGNPDRAACHEDTYGLAHQQKLLSSMQLAM